MRALLLVLNLESQLLILSRGRKFPPMGWNMFWRWLHLGFRSGAPFSALTHPVTLQVILSIVAFICRWLMNFVVNRCQNHLWKCFVLGRWLSSRFQAIWLISAAHWVLKSLGAQFGICHVYSVNQALEACLLEISRSLLCLEPMFKGQSVEKIFFPKTHGLQVGPGFLVWAPVPLSACFCAHVGVSHSSSRCFWPRFVCFCHWY